MDFVTFFQIVDGGGNAALMALAFMVWNLRRDFKHAQEKSELKHGHIDDRFNRADEQFKRIELRLNQMQGGNND